MRRGYERKPWRLKGWRQTAYPIALLDNIDAGNGGQALLALVNDVRNESGRTDPLLIVAACPAVPPESEGQRVAWIADIDQDTYPQ